MKSTHLLSLQYGLTLVSPLRKLFFILPILFSDLVHAQQSDLACNTVIPWTADTFALEVDFSSSLLACWDGDIGCIIPGSNAPANVIDNNLSNFASGEILVGGFLTLSVTDPVNDYEAGNFAGFVISSGLLEANVFNSITIRTYSNNNLQETFPGYDLIGLNSALFDSPYTIGFVTSADFDEVEITFAAGIAAGFYNVHYAVMGGFCEGPELSCNEHTQMNAPTFPMTIDYELTGSTGISISDIDDPENAISSSTTDFASLNNLVDALDSLSIAVEEQIIDYPSGTFVGFDIENITILGLGLLDNIVITTYLNGVEQQQKAASDLLLGVPLLSAPGRQTVGFVTNTAVDKVRFTLANPAAISLGTTLVYSAIFTQFCEGPDLPCNELTSIYSPLYPVYINAFRSGFEGAACVDCSIEDPDRVIDNDPSSYAEIDITAGVATIGSISVKDELTDYPANTFAGFHIENVQLVDANVLVDVTITTYLDGAFSEFVSGPNILLTAGTDLLVNQGEFYAGFVTTAPFDEVRISLTNVGSVNIGTTRIYEALFGMFCPTDIECDTNYFFNTPEFPVYVDFHLTGLSGIACALCEVEDPDEVITASNTDFASITITAGVIETGSIAVRDALYVYPPGTIAGFVIEDLNDLLQADLFGSLTISTYLDGDLQEFAFGVNLIDAELLILFINPDAGVYNVGFQTSMPFDEVRITVGSLASVINLIDVYGAFVDTRYSVGGDSLNCPNPPIAIDDVATTPEDTPVVIDVLDNDSDPDSPLGVPVINDLPTNGMVAVNPGDSTVTYTPNEGFVGIDSFTYIICDNGLPPLCDTALVVVTVVPVIDTIYFTIPEDSVISVCANELTTFTTPAILISLCESPSGGSVSINSTCATYTLDEGNNENDTFCLVVCDPMVPSLCDTTIVIINVTAVNDPPVAVDDAATTPEDTPVVIDVLNNDSDPDGEIGIPDITEPPSNGTAMVNPVDSTVTYTPNENFVGVDTFMYAICDDSLPPLCDTALVIITVAPVIDTIYENIPEDSSVTECAVELTTFTTPATAIALCDDPSDGTVTILNTCATYTPNDGFVGLDTFCLVVCDPLNPTLCDTTIVIVTVGPLNDPPVAVDDAATTPEETPVVIDVLNNDSDPDSPLGIPSTIDPPSHGTTVSSAVDSTYTYTPDLNFVGIDSFTYAICDDGLPPLCDTALVVITVTPVIDTIYETLEQDSSFTVCADELTIFTTPATGMSLCDGPSSGVATITGTCATYTHNPGFIGNDTFCLVTCDPLQPLLCDTTIVIITVLPPVCLNVNTWVYLEGACITASGNPLYAIPMQNILNAEHVIPGQCLEDPFFGTKCTPPGQPYNVPPWNYPGLEGENYTPDQDITDGDAGYPSTVVDWVYISLRDSIDGNGGPVCEAAALVHQDGHIEFTEPFNCCGLNTGIPYYIAIEHRNHLIVMSDEPVLAVNDTLTYDFRIQQSYLLDPLDIGIYAQQKEIMPGVFAMFAGNGNQITGPNSDTDINFDDRSFWENLAGPVGTYNQADYNLNADTNFNDRVVWERNNGKFTSVVRN